MEKLIYKQAYDKIIEAYFKDEIEPQDAQFCFCGTLNNNNANWGDYYKDGDTKNYYSQNEYCKMENALFEGITRGQPTLISMLRGNPDWEDRIFEGMCAALDVLKQIHRERGENVDDFEFVKRELIHK